MILKGLLADFGTAFDPTDDVSINNFSWVEANAWARAINSAWGQSRRLRNQFDPLRMTDFLPRWEKIFRITPQLDATLVARRIEVARRFALIGAPSTPAGLDALCRILLPNTYVQLHFLSNHWAHNQTPVDVFYPDTGTPLGTHAAAGTGGWSSTIHHVAIELHQPTWMANEDYYREARSIYAGIVDNFIPAWATFSAFKGPTLGFFLDSSGNLDNEGIGIVSLGNLTVNGPAVTQPIFPYLFATGATVSTSGSKTYANFYGFTLSGGPTALTITLSVGTAPDVGGRLIQGSDPYGGGTSLLFHNTLTVAAAPDGDWVLEVNTNTANTLGTSPGTVTMQITSP